MRNLTVHLSIRVLFCIIAAAVVIPHAGFAEGDAGLRPLLHLHRSAWHTVLPGGTLLLDSPAAIEQFLVSVDRMPPDWAQLYGSDGAGHDERLFALNRERDRRRDGRVPTQRLAFFWTGELSMDDSTPGAFHVAIGPNVVPTQWGLVLFKPEGLPSNLVALASPALTQDLKKRMAHGERIEIDVAMSGRLLAEESIIYDFAHEEAGRGMVMPVIVIDHLEYGLDR